MPRGSRWHMLSCCQLYHSLLGTNSAMGLTKGIMMDPIKFIHKKAQRARGQFSKMKGVD